MIKIGLSLSRLLEYNTLGITTVTYVPVLINGALPPNKEKEEIVPTYKKKEQTGSTLIKEHLEETVQLVTREQPVLL